MKAFAAFVVAAVATAAVFGQKLPTLGPAIGVDMRVDWVNWHNKGDALLYTRIETPGWRGLGVYGLGKEEGKLLIHLLDGDQWEALWFENETRALALIRRPGQGPNKDQIEGSIYVIDANSGTARKIYTRIYPPKTGVGYDVEIAPSSVHAIIKVTEGEKRYHLVLPTNGFGLLPSPDLDKAVNEGAAGPVWSNSGTANYIVAQSQSALESKSQSGVELAVSSEVLVKFKSAQSFEIPLVDLPVVGMFFKIKMAVAPPPVGTPVFELIPFNAVLRPVRFKGPWVSEPVETVALEPRETASTLQFGLSQGYSTSLWLTERGEKVSRSGILIASHASLSWLAPRNKAVAYLTDGALFVRKLIP